MLKFKFKIEVLFLSFLTLKFDRLTLPNLITSYDMGFVRFLSFYPIYCDIYSTISVIRLECNKSYLRSF